MPGDDHISGGGGRVVFGDVRLPPDRESLGLDWRGSCRDSGTAAAFESAVISCPTVCLAHYLDTLRCLPAPILH